MSAKLDEIAAAFFPESAERFSRCRAAVGRAYDLGRAKLAEAQEEIKGYDEDLFTVNRRADAAEAEVARLREDLDELALRVDAYRAAPIDARDDPRSWSNLGKLLMACDNIQRHREGEK